MLTGKFWVGVGLLAVALGFLMAVVFGKVQFDRTRHGIVRLFAAICAGTSGLLMTGDAVLTFSGQIGENAKLAFTAVGGVALFGLVWLTFGPFEPPVPETTEVSLGVPEGWTFEQLLREIADSGHSLVDFRGFSRSELDAPLRKAQFRAPDTQHALAMSRTLVRTDSFPEYDVELRDGVYTISRK